MEDLEGFVMWKCAECGCMEIAPTLDVCPQCRAPRPDPEAPAAPDPGSGTQVEDTGSESGPQAEIEGDQTVPRASLGGYSNAAAGEQVTYGGDLPPAEEILEDQEQEVAMDSAEKAIGDEKEDEEVKSSAGTSSSTSESSLDKSGTPSTTGPQSPAQETDSPSSKDQAQNLESSTAPSTDGSGQGTTSGQASQPDSSADSAPEGPATPGRTTKGRRGSAI